MKVSNMKYQLILPMSFDDMLRHIENCGRICYKSEGNKTKDSWKTWVIDKIEMGHESLLEHCSFSVRFKTDRGVTHELVRHRIASYSQESTRYCNYASDKFNNSISVINILNGIKLDTKMKDLDSKSLDLILQEWYKAMEDAETHYNKMIELGTTPQIARSVLPNSVKTEIMVTANIREWRNILKLRTAKPAHPQIRELLVPLLLDLQDKCPQLFGDIVPYMTSYTGGDK